jgi:hypothetical protein
VVVGVWRLALGWDWSTSGEERHRNTVAQTPLDWLTLAIVVVVAIGWLALRGRAVLGFVAVCVPVVVLSGWRLAAGDVLDWPSQVAALIFGLSVTGMPVALLGWWLRQRVAVAAAKSSGPADSLGPAEASGSGETLGPPEPPGRAEHLGPAETDDSAGGAAEPVDE